MHKLGWWATRSMPCLRRMCMTSDEGTSTSIWRKFYGFLDITVEKYK